MFATLFIAPIVLPRLCNVLETTTSRLASLVKLKRRVSAMHEDPVPAMLLIPMYVLAEPSKLADIRREMADTLLKHPAAQGALYAQQTGLTKFCTCGWFGSAALINAGQCPACTGKEHQ